MNQARPYSQEPERIVQGDHHPVSLFTTDVTNANIDNEVVKGFGEEWEKFNEFSDAELQEIGDKYFDIVTPAMLSSNSYCIDIGCGTGRWSKYLSSKAGFIECVDPSQAIFVADKVLGNVNNVRLTKASTDNLPFPDETFDFGMSIGVLHHIPDTQKALSDCVRKIKQGGYFYVYLYYALDNRGWLFRAIFAAVNFIRRIVSSLPKGIKKFVCDCIALLVYWPLARLSWLLSKAGLKKPAEKIPLSGYKDTSFFIMRNDALDRFGTKLEQRFSRAQVIGMMQQAGLAEISVSPNFPYWHAIGKRVN
jgi:SAM-dependent methyltransferase